MKSKNVKYSGIYVLKFSSGTIKVGRSKDVERRLKQYRGYHA